MFHTIISNSEFPLLYGLLAGYRSLLISAMSVLSLRFFSPVMRHPL